MKFQNNSHSKQKSVLLFDKAEKECYIFSQRYFFNSILPFSTKLQAVCMKDFVMKATTQPTQNGIRRNPPVSTQSQAVVF